MQTITAAKRVLYLRTLGGGGTNRENKKEAVLATFIGFNHAGTRSVIQLGPESGLLPRTAKVLIRNTWPCCPECDRALTVGDLKRPSVVLEAVELYAEEHGGACLGTQHCPRCHSDCHDDPTIQDHGHCYDCQRRWQLGETEQDAGR